LVEGVFITNKKKKKRPGNSKILWRLCSSTVLRNRKEEKIKGGTEKIAKAARFSRRGKNATSNGGKKHGNVLERGEKIVQRWTDQVIRLCKPALKRQQKGEKGAKTYQNQQVIGSSKKLSA